jgi:hypothetical protein
VLEYLLNPLFVPARGKLTLLHLFLLRRLLKAQSALGPKNLFHLCLLDVMSV